MLGLPNLAAEVSAAVLTPWVQTTARLSLHAHGTSIRTPTVHIHTHIYTELCRSAQAENAVLTQTEAVAS